MSEQRGKTIHVTQEVHDRLTARGRFKDSYNTIIQRLLDELDELSMEVPSGGQEEGSE